MLFHSRAYVQPGHKSSNYCTNNENMWKEIKIMTCGVRVGGGGGGGGVATRCTQADKVEQKDGKLVTLNCIMRNYIETSDPDQPQACFSSKGHFS